MSGGQAMSANKTGLTKSKLSKALKKMKLINTLIIDGEKYYIVTKDGFKGIPNQILYSTNPAIICSEKEKDILDEAVKHIKGVKQ